MKKHKLKDYIIISVLISFSVVLSLFDRYISNALLSVIPFLGVMVPNFKLGLANIIILIILINYNFKLSVLAVILKVIVVGLFNPNGLPMSFGGTFFSFVAMMLLFKCLGKGKHIYFVSAVGGFMHSLGQILFAFMYYGLIDIKNIVINHQIDLNVLIYAPCILIAGLITGIFVGAVAKLLNKYIYKLNIIEIERKEK